MRNLGLTFYSCTFLFPIKLIKFVKKHFMYHAIQHVHSTLAYVVFAMLLFAIVNSFLGLSSKRNFEKKDRTLGLLGLIFSHLQLVAGIVLWATSPLGLEAMSAMSDASLRLTAVEHPIVNILAIAAITIGWSKHKKEDSSNGKFKKIAVFYFIGFLLLLSRIPWNLWF